jgi:starch phosphorylase
MPEFLGKVIFLENYDMTLSKRLITGVDVWLNTPTRPLEASGTSGEKAEMNGLLNFSVLDGWWYEGYREGAGWALTSKRTYTDQSQQDRLDSATIYSMLENEIIPLYFAKNSKGYSPEWVQYIKNSMVHIAPNYTMSRMMRDYFDKFYKPQAKRASQLMAKDYAMAREIVKWKEKVAARWDDVALVGDIMGNREAIASGTADIDVTMRLDTAGLGDDVKLELVVYKEEDGQTTFYRKASFDVVAKDGNILTYNCKVPFRENGIFRYAYRAYPWNDLLPHRQDFAYLKWF